MKNLIARIATCLALFSLSACAVGFGESYPPEPLPAPPYASPYPYPYPAPAPYYASPGYYEPGYIVPPPVTLGFGFRFGGRGDHFAHGGRFAHSGHWPGHGSIHHG